MDWMEYKAEHRISGGTTDWIDGHPLGNGDVGALVWGNPQNVYLGFSKHDVNDLRRNPQSEGWLHSYQELKRMAEEGRRGLDKLFVQKIPRAGIYSGPFPLPCGRLALEIFRGTQTVGYAQTLKMREAVCECVCEPTPAAKNWGHSYEPAKISSWIHPDRNVAVVQLECGTETAATFRYDLSAESGIPTLPICKVDGGVGILSQELPENTSYAAAIGVVSRECRMAATELGVSGALRFGGKAGRAVIYISLASGYDSGSVGAPAFAAELLAWAFCSGVDALRNSHIDWWRKFWEKSEIWYEDETVCRLWWFGVYALASSARPGKSPPHLQGIWTQYDCPPWHSDFHFNANIQMAHWVACPSNHPELQEALLDALLVRWRERLRENASMVYGARGVAFPLCSDWLGRALGWGYLSVALSMTAWMAEHVWWQWLYTRNLPLLKDRIFPFLRECVQFYFDVLVEREDGLFHIAVSQSPEQVAWRNDDGEVYIGLGSDPAIDLVFIRELMKSFMDAGKILGVDDEDVKKAADVLKRLPQNPVGEGVLIDFAVGFFHEGDAPGHFKVCHRHPSRLSGIFPAEEINSSSPKEVLELGMRSFREFMGYGDAGFTGWSTAWQAAIAARLGLADEAERILRIQQEHFTLKGLFNSHNSVSGKYGMAGGPLFQIDGTLGSAAAVNEMLLQSTGGLIRVFPAVPEKRKASFRNLRAQGAFLVSAEKDETGTRFVEILSETESIAAVSNPWPGREVRIEEGGGSRKAAGERISIPIGRGQKVRLVRA